MDIAKWWFIDIILPAVLVIALVWLAMRRSNMTTKRTENATDELYREEDKRRREGTDDL